MLWALLLLSCDGTPADSDSSEPWDTSVHTGETDAPCAEVDADGDGANACDDCDDGDPAVRPGAVERCDGKDGDCDGDPLPDEVDADGDDVPDCAWCDQAGYWQLTRSADDSALRAALKNATQMGGCDYSDTTKFMFVELDKQGGQVECVYTGRRTNVGSNKPDSTDMNTEHTWPQSLGADSEPAKCDLHHLYPTDADANGRRGNEDFGNVTSGVTWSEGGSRLGKDSSGKTVFEPRAVHKGNVARSMLYFAMRYGHTLPAKQVDVFLAWNAADPVDARERDRTFAIADHQAHANPYVVCPGLAERDWR